MNSALKTLLNDLKQYPLLTADEEKALARRAQSGDSAAAEQLVCCNMRLVVSIAKRYQNSHMELMDLIQEGASGLMQAVEKYNPELGYRFSTCATPWIKQAITKSLIQKGRSIRIPAHIYQKLSKYRQTIADLTHKLGRQPSTEEIAAALNIDVEEATSLEDLRYDTVDLDTPIGNDNDEDTLADLQEDQSCENPERYCERRSMEDDIERMIASLKPRTQIIVKMRYGIRCEGDPADFAREHTLDEIGAYVGLTRERTRQILKETEAALRPQAKRLVQ